MDLGFGQWKSDNDGGSDMQSIPIGDAPEFSADFDMVPLHGQDADDMQSIPILPIGEEESFSAKFDVPDTSPANESEKITQKFSPGSDEASTLALDLAHLESTNADATAIELNKRLKSLSRRRKKPSVLFKKFLSLYQKNNRFFKTYCI